MLLPSFDVNEIINGSSNLQEPYTLPNFFDDKFFNEKDVVSMLRSMIINKTTAALRIFTEQGRRHDLESKTFNNPPVIENSLNNWINEVFGNQKFGVIINKAEQFNDILTQKVGHFLIPLFEKIGVPLGGAEIAFFIGNYGYTPFGVHQDKDEKCVFHFHLGPGQKEILLWAPENFEKITGSRETCFNPESIRKDARVCVIKKHDFFVLPAHYYHIGYTEEFSIGMAIAIVGITNKQYLEKVLSTIYNKFFIAGPQYELKPSSLANPRETLIDELMLNEMHDNYQKGLFSELVQEAAEDFHYSRLSNLGFNYPPVPIQEKIDSTALSSLKIESVSPFKLYIRKLPNGKSAVYARHQKIAVKSHALLNTLVEKLNAGNIIHLSKDFQNIIDDWSPKTVIGFLNALYRFGAIKVNY